MDLGGATAIVTGAGRRVGRAIAEELGRAGARVAVHFHRSRDGAAATCAAIHAAGGEALAIEGDLRDTDAAKQLVDTAQRALGPAAVLVNSAAAFERLPFEDIGDDGWADMLALNLLAPARLSRLVLPGMRARGAGVIVNVLDVAAISAWRWHAHYSASKAALGMLTKTLALELAPTVRVVGVAPGTVAFPESYGEAERAAVLRRIPLGRTGEPSDVARAVRFLVESDYLTGVILPIDGGRLVDAGGLL